MDVDTLKSQLIQDEGVRSSAYRDSEGFLTIGVGHLIDSALGGKLDDDVIEHQLKNDIERVEKDLQTFPWWSYLDSVRQVALANLRFQLGPTRFRGFKKMLEAVEKGDFETAGAELLDSLYAKQVPKRAARVAFQLRTGKT